MTPEPVAAPPPLTGLGEAERARALPRFQLLRPFLEEGVPLTAVARQELRSLRTLRAWVARYRRDGLTGLGRRPRADRGTPRRVPPELRLLIEGLALQRPRLTAAQIHRRVAAIAPERAWPTPSYRTVAALLQRLDSALATLAHEVAKVFQDRYDLLYRRESSQPNEVWRADHTPLDLWARGADGQPLRPWLTVILDDYSRAVAAYRLSVASPTILHTALCLRDAIWRKADPRWPICGIPAAFYTDHGSDFTSQHLEQVGADLRMALIFSRPGRPRGCGRIERFFQTITQFCLSGLPDYAPPGHRPPTPSLTPDELDRRLRTFLLEDYHRRVHGGTGMAPQARWEAGGFLPNLPESLKQLDLLLLTVAKPRVVQQDGIHFQGLRYLDLTLSAYIGEPVVIRYDPADLAELQVYHHERFLCRAVCQELAGQTISLKAIVQARTQRRRQVRDGLTERAKLLDQLLAGQPPVAAGAAPETDARPARLRLKRYRDD